METERGKRAQYKEEVKVESRGRCEAEIKKSQGKK